MSDDPYRHHPELRGKIRDVSESYFRDFSPADLDAQMAQVGLPADWRFSDAEREAARKAVVAQRPDEDLWVFAYGSLMWDPAIHFVEVRKARLEGYARSFCLRDAIGGRGSPESPGLMAALDEGDGCEGLVFRIAAHEVERETEVLWRRELFLPTYLPRFLDVHTQLGTVSALTMVADHGADLIVCDIPRAEQVRYLATGEGVLGTSFEYIDKLAAQLRLIGIDDSELFALLEDVKRFRRNGETE